MTPDPNNTAGSDCPEATCSPSFQRVLLTDATVNKMLKYGATKEDVIVELVAQRDKMMARVMELELIAPKKIRSPDGRTWIYRCPDHLIPENDKIQQPRAEKDV